MRSISNDPGIKGGITVLDSETGQAWVYRTPTIKIPKKGNSKAKVEYDLAGIKTIIEETRPDIGFIELVHAMPRQGVSSTFFFGKGFGIMIGMMGAFGIPINYVTPQKWKTYFELTADKSDAREYATKIAPDLSEKWKLKRDDGVAESFLIGHYGMIQNGITNLTYKLDIA